MKIKLSLLFLIFTGLVACTKKTGSGNSGAAMISPWIKLEDAKEFLPSWSKENTLIYHITAEPNDMHPTNGSSSPRSEINLYTQMFIINTDMENTGVSPGLIKSLPTVSTDGLEYTYELRDEPVWDDGNKLSVDDIVFTCKAIKCPLTNNPHQKPYWDNLKEIKTDAANPKKFILIMKRPYMQNVLFLTDNPVMERSFYDPKNVLSHFMLEQFDNPGFKSDEQKELVEWSNEFNNEKYGHDVQFFTGLGMYKIENWEQGQYITLVKKKNHWTENSKDYREIAYPEKIIFKLNKDDNSSMLEFKAQAMDASTNLSAKTLMTLKENDEFNKNYNSIFSLSYNYTYMAMNEKPDGSIHKKLFTDQKVRRAMAHLTPVDNIIKFVYKNYSDQCKRVVTNVSPLKKELNTDLTPIPLDLEKAKQLLDEAGWKDSDGDGIRDKIIDGEKVQLSFDLMCMNAGGDWKDMAAMVSEEMKKAGVKANVTPLDLKVFLEKARNHDFDMMMGVWGGNSAGEDFTQIWHTSSWISKGSNYTGFGDAYSDALIDSIKFSLDDKKHIELSGKLQEIVYTDQPYVFMYAGLRRNVIHKRFGNTEVFCERPGLLLNMLKLLSGTKGIAMKNETSP